MTGRYDPIADSDRPRDQYMTVPEIAREMRVSKMTVYRLLHAPGGLPAIRVGRSWRVRERDLDRYIRNADATSWEAL